MWYARFVMSWPKGARTRHSKPCRFFSHTSACPSASSLRLTGKQCRRLGNEVHQWMQEMQKPGRRKSGAAANSGEGASLNLASQWKVCGRV